MGQRGAALHTSALDPSKAISPEQLSAAVGEFIARQSSFQVKSQASSKDLVVPDESYAVDFSYLGVGVSRDNLRNYFGDPHRLREHKLPQLNTPHDIADLLNVSLRELRWLAYDAIHSRYSHYFSFTIPKKPTGERTICAPNKLLKGAQTMLLRKVVDLFPTSGHAHGFVRERSAFTNAAPHVSKGVVINLDLKDFFPSIHIHKVTNVFVDYGYSPAISTILALLCTKRPNVTDKKVRDRIHYQFSGERGLPQGAPTSPGLANQVAARMDRRLAAYAKSIGFEYTRYADDLTLSGKRLNRERHDQILAKMVLIAETSGFTPHPEKRHIGTAGGRQQVTGYNVNTMVSVPKDYRRDLRHRLYMVEHGSRDGRQWTLHDQHQYEVENRGASNSIGLWLLGVFGQISFISSAHQKEGAKRKHLLRRLVRRDGLVAELREARRGGTYDVGDHSE